MITYFFIILICFFINFYYSYISVPESVSCYNNMIYQIKTSDKTYFIYASKYSFYLKKDGNLVSIQNTIQYDNYSSIKYSNTYGTAFLINNSLIVNNPSNIRYNLYSSYNPKYYSMFFVSDSIKIIVLNENTGYADVFTYNYTSSSINKIHSYEQIDSYSKITSFKCNPMSSTLKIFCVYIIDKNVYFKTFSLYTINSKYTYLMFDTLDKSIITEFGESYGANFYYVFDRLNKQLICSINSNRKVDCYTFELTESNYLLTTPSINNILNYCNTDINDFVINYFIEDELLACCTNTTNVICQRLTSDLT